MCMVNLRTCLHLVTEQGSDNRQTSERSLWRLYTITVSVLPPANSLERSTHNLSFGNTVKLRWRNPFVRTASNTMASSTSLVTTEHATRDSMQLIHRLVQPDPHDNLRDEDTNYYCAQLKLYGLLVPENEDRHVAKGWLKLALKQYKLEVSANLIQLEVRMRTDWAATNRGKKQSVRTATRVRSRTPSREIVGNAGSDNGLRSGSHIQGSSEHIASKYHIKVMQPRYADSDNWCIRPAPSQSRSLQHT